MAALHNTNVGMLTKGKNIPHTVVNIDVQAITQDKMDQSVPAATRAAIMITQDSEGEVYRQVTGEYYWFPCAESKDDDIDPPKDFPAGNMSYFNFVQAHVPADDQLNAITNFTDGIGSQYKDRYNALIAHIESDNTVIPSFIKFLEHIKDIPHKLIFRAYTTAEVDIVKGLIESGIIGDITHGSFISSTDKHTLQIGDYEFTHGHEIVTFIESTGPHLCIMDDYSRWIASGKTIDGGRPMMMGTVDRQCFFARRSYVTPCDAMSRHALCGHRRVWIVDVPGAIMDDNYFVNAFTKMGYDTTSSD